MPNRHGDRHACRRAGGRPQPTLVTPAMSLPDNLDGIWSAVSDTFLDGEWWRIREVITNTFGCTEVNIITYGPDESSSTNNSSTNNSNTNNSNSGGSIVDPPTTEPQQPPEPTPKPKPKPTETARPETRPAEKPALTVKVVNLKISANGAAHHTNKYEISKPLERSPKLVVRRGQAFNIDIEFNRPYDPKSDDLKLIFEAGDKPLASKGTYVEFILSDDDLPKEWGAKIVSSEGYVTSIDIFTPPTCYVGKWVFKIDVIKKDNTSINVFRYQHKEPIYIIFNPWCKDDTVYMEDESLLKEYILNETGTIYTASMTSIQEKPWNFGQFESRVLDVALYILELTEMSWQVRGNPIPIIRKISALVNAQDDGGVLSGKWNGDYSGGTSPLSWTGSVPILEEFWANHKPVRYGQCWVFSGVCTTLARTLGIPTRSVTNFESAHDTDGSITMDLHYKANNEPVASSKRDSVWNFHVWNEAYMARPDLPAGYGGWQAFDATPQETSDGVYCGGPTSVIAIQQGEVNLPYDGPFVFAEVNADKLCWKLDERNVFRCISVEKRAIGKYISTKAANSTKREDITWNYKYPEGSAEERAAVLKANQVASSRKDIYKKSVDDVKFRVIQDTENTWLGASFEVGLSMKNNSTKKRSVSGRIVVSTMFYTGIDAEKLKSEPFTYTLQPGEEKAQHVVVIQDEYDGKLKDCCMLDVSILAHVEETGQYFTIKENYTLRKPHLSIKAPDEAVVDKEFKIDVSFTNPLSSSLTGCFVAVDGVARAIKFPQGNVSPSGTFTATLPITPTKVGRQEIICVFNSKQLEDINTSTPILVRAA